MRLSIICLSYFLFINLVVAREQDDINPILHPTLSLQQLEETLRPISPRFNTAPLSPRSKVFFNIQETEEIYSTLQSHGYSRLQTLGTLKENNKYKNKIHLIPTVNRLLQKHLNNIYSDDAKTILLNNLPKNKQDPIIMLEKIIISHDFDYRKVSDEAFQWFGLNMIHYDCNTITITTTYSKALDMLFAAYAQPKMILTQNTKETT